jgi:hypothetical protein
LDLCVRLFSILDRNAAERSNGAQVRSVDLINGDFFAIAAPGRRECAKDRSEPANRDALLPNVVALPKSSLPLRVEPNSYVFTNGQVKPSGISSRAARAEDSPAAFYKMRHTFISIALTLGCNAKRIAQQTGTCK